jgi:hypothetical protein
MVPSIATPNRDFDGIIDEVRITSRALPSSEIKTNSELAGTYYWKVKVEDEWGNVTTSPAQFFYMQSYICDDANGDGAVNVGDAVYLIAYIFNSGPEPDPVCAGDANGDYQLNVGDAVYLIAYIFNNGAAPTMHCCP